MRKKKNGVVYTPPEVVNKMLDMVGYFPEKMPGFLDMDFMDNSCGNGNILVVALERACDAIDKMCSELGFTPEEKYNYFEHGLTGHFHGMEIDAVECAKCKERMNKVVGNYLCQPVDWQWDIRCCDSLTVSDDRKFDFVVCNPPYVRTHNLDNNLDGYKFVEQGMKDLYLAFYELGLRQMKHDGRMCYITPSSWFTSTAGRSLRKYLYDNKLISEIYDYGHTQVFENVVTYVEITAIDGLNSRIGIEYYVKYGSEELGDEVYMIPYDEFSFDGKFYFTDEDTGDMLEDVMRCHEGNIKVKNGYATLADDVFINPRGCNSENLPVAREIIHNLCPDNFIPVIKSSTGKSGWCKYPYDKQGNLLGEDAIDPAILKELARHKDKLLARSTKEPWYAFGRTQAINDTYKDKWAIKSIIKTLDDINPVKAPAGTGVYGGLYIICEDESQLDCLKTEEFLNYVKSLKKYKSGGYYAFSSKDLENYLNWKNYAQVKEHEA